MKQEGIDKPRGDLRPCPICKVPAELDKEFCWIISAPLLSLFLVGWESYYVDLPCCGRCYRKIGHRRILQITLLILIPILFVQGFIIKQLAFPEMSEVLFCLYLIAMAGVVWTGLFSLTGLNRVRVHDDKLIEKGKQLSRKRLKNSTPWFILAYSPRGSERIEFEDDTEKPKQ